MPTVSEEMIMKKKLKTSFYGLIDSISEEIKEEIRKDMATKDDIVRLEKKFDDTRDLRKQVDELKKRLDQVEAELQRVRARN